MQRLVLAWLVFLPLCLRAMAPAGYMPGSLADGMLFVPCPNGSPGIRYFLEPGKDAVSPEHAHHGGGEDSAGIPWETCSFGMAFAPFAPAPHTVDGLESANGFDEAAAPPVLLRAANSRTFLARGPPLLTSG